MIIFSQKEDVSPPLLNKSKYLCRHRRVVKVHL